MGPLLIHEFMAPYANEDFLSLSEDFDHSKEETLS